MLSKSKNIINLFSKSSFSLAPSFTFAGKKEATSEPTSVKPPNKLKHAAVVLSGCGVYDGSEITEAVSLFIALSEKKVKFQCYAVNKTQTDVIDHLTGKPMNEKRNTMVESARIARGKVKDIKELDQTNYDAVFFPGGFGAAKNLSDFASKGADMTLDSEVERVLKIFNENQKPIGLACIAPVLAAKYFGAAGKKVTITLGSKGDHWPHQGSMDAAEKMGATCSARPTTRACADLKNLVFTAPAFMKETTDFHEIYGSIRGLVESVDQGLNDVKKKAEEVKAAKKEKRAKKVAAKKERKEASQ